MASKICKNIAILIAYLGSYASVAQTVDLSWPEESFSIETVNGEVRAVSQIEEKVFVFLKNSKLVLRIPFVWSETKRELRFGKITDQERLFISGDEGSMWRAIDRVDGRTLVFDGARLAVADVDGQKFSTVVQRAIPWDLLKPPADRGGEATRSETAEMRKRFSRAMLAAPPLKFAGFARVPDSWKINMAAGMGQAYLVATRLSGFPLVLMECRKDEPSQCLVARYCQLTSSFDIAPEAVTGIGIIRDSKTIIIGDAARHRLISYKWQSCYGLSKQRKSWQLPGQIKNMRGFSIDQDGRLWVGSDQPDDYLNASVYVWNNW